jgi:hypothetical protein
MTLRVLFPRRASWVALVGFVMGVVTTALPVRAQPSSGGGVTTDPATAGPANVGEVPPVPPSVGPKVLRSTVPLARPESWPAGDRAPVPFAEFERWWQQHASSSGERSEPVLERATYTVTPLADGGWGGDFEWSVIAPAVNMAGDPAPMALRVPATDLILESLRTAAGTDLDWGVTESGAWLMPVTSARSRLLGKWSHPANPSLAEPNVAFDEIVLHVPLGVTTRLKWRVPLDRTLEALTPANVVPGKVDGDAREWLVAVGSTPVRIAMRRAEREPSREIGRPVYSMDTAVAVRPDSTRCQSDLVVTAATAPLDALTLRLPAKSSLLSVHLQDTPLETRYPEVERPEIVEVRFPESMTGEFGPVRVRWIAGPREAGRIVAEAPEIEGGVFLDGNFAVRVEQPFRVADFDTFGLRPSSAVTRSDGDAISARQWRRDARMTLRIGEAPFAATVDQAVRLHIGEELATATLRTFWTATTGQSRSLAVRIPEPWLVLDVRPVSSGASTQVVAAEAFAWHPGDTERSVEIELVEPLASGATLILDLVLSTPRSDFLASGAASLPVPVAIPLTGTATGPWLAVSTSEARPFRLRSQGADIGSAPWPAKYATLTAPAAESAIGIGSVASFPLENPAARYELMLGDPPDPVDLRCVVSVVVDDEGQLAEEIEVVARPTGKTVDRFTLRGLDGSARWNWRVTAPSALRVTVRPSSPTVTVEPQSPRADEPFGASAGDAKGEWLVELSEPVSGPVVIKGVRDGSRRPPCATSLPRGPRARAFEGVLRLDAPRGYVPFLTGADWLPALGTTVSGGSASVEAGSNRVRVDRPFPVGVDSASWTPPAVSASGESDLVCEAEVECLLSADDGVGQPARHMVSIRLHGLPTRAFDLAWKLSEETVRCRCVADGRPVPVVRDGVRFSCAIPGTASLARQVLIEYQLTDDTATTNTAGAEVGVSPSWITTAELPLPLWSPRVSACTLSIALPAGRELVGSPVGPQGFWNEVLVVPDVASDTTLSSRSTLSEALARLFEGSSPTDRSLLPSKSFRAGDYISPHERRSARRFHVVGAPTRVSVSVHNTSLRDVLGWFVGCLSLAVALAIRTFRGPSTRRWRLFVPLMLLPLVAVAPEPLRTVAAAGLAAYALGWILPARWLRPPRRDSRTRRSDTRSVVSHRLPAGTLGVCWLCGILAGQVHAQSTPTPNGISTDAPAPSRPLEVLLPVDETGRLPADGVAYVPIELLGQISAAREAFEMPLLAGPAEYRVTPKADGSLGVVARLEFRAPTWPAATSSADGLSRPGPLLIPLPWTDVRWDASRPALANGRPAPLVREGRRVSLLVTREPTDRRAAPGTLSRDVVELAFHIPMSEGRWTLPLSTAPQHRFTRDEPSASPPNAAGNETTSPAPHISVDGGVPRPFEAAVPLRVGPLSRRVDLFPARTTFAGRSRFTCTAETVVEVRADLIAVRVLLTGRSEGPVPDRWHWALPAGWEVSALDATSVNPRLDSSHRDGQSVIEVIRSGSEPLDWSVSFTLRRPRGASDEPIELPAPAWIPVEGADKSTRSVVVETGTPRVLIRLMPGFEMEFPDSDDELAVPLPPDPRLSARVPSDLPSWGMYRALRDVPWRLLVRETATSLKVRTDLNLLVDRDRLTVELAAWVDDPTRSRLVLRPRLPEGFVVADVEVLEGEVSRLWRWTRDGDRLNVLLSERPRQRQRVIVRGTLPTGTGQTESALPKWTWPGEQEDTGAVSLWTATGLAPVTVAGGTSAPTTTVSNSTAPTSTPPSTDTPFPAANLVGRWTGTEVPTSFRRTTHEAGRVAYGMVRGLGTTASGALRVEYRLRLFGPPLVAEFPSVMFPRVWSKIAPQGRPGLSVKAPTSAETGWELRPEAKADGTNIDTAKFEVVWLAEIPPVEAEGVWRVFPPAVSRVGTLETGWGAPRNLGFTSSPTVDRHTSVEFQRAFVDSITEAVAPAPLSAAGIIVSGSVEPANQSRSQQAFPDYWQHLVRIGAEGGLDGETWALFPGDSVSTFVPLPDGVEIFARVGERGIATQSVDSRVRVTDSLPPTLRLEHIRWRVPVAPDVRPATTGEVGAPSTTSPPGDAEPAAGGLSPWSILRKSISFSGAAATRPQPIAIAFAPEWSTRLLPAPSAEGRLTFRLFQAERLLDLLEHGLALDTAGSAAPSTSEHSIAEWPAWRFALKALLDVPDPVAEERSPDMTARWSTLRSRLARIESVSGDGSGEATARRFSVSKEELLRSGRGLPIFDGNPGLIAAGEGIDYVLIEPAGSWPPLSGAGVGGTDSDAQTATAMPPIALRMVSIARFWNLLFAGSGASLAFLAASRFLPLGRFLVWVQARAWRGALVAVAVLWGAGLLGSWGLPVVVAVLTFGTLETLARRRPRAVVGGQ